MIHFELRRKEYGLWVRHSQSTNFDVLHEEFQRLQKHPVSKQYPMQIVEAKEVYKTCVEWPGESVAHPAEPSGGPKT